jgi:hypothetical protein
MSLTTVEISDLLRRAQLSVVRGYTIARADFYARELGGSDESPAGLLALCRAAVEKDAPAPSDAPELPEGESEPKALPEKASAGETEPASPVPPAEPEPVAAAAEPEPEPEPAPAPEPEEEAHDDNAEAYESWSKKKLLAAAVERNLDVNAHNTKAEIIAALRGDG